MISIFREVDRGEHLNEGRVRRKGSGRKGTLSKHPEYITVFREIVEFDIAGHRLFSQISRVWSGAVFNTIEEASELASRARTKTGLAVFTSINRRIYETKTERNPLFESECDRHIVKDEILPKWNYLVRCN